MINTYYQATKRESVSTNWINEGMKILDKFKSLDPHNFFTNVTKCSPNHISNYRSLWIIIKLKYKIHPIQSVAFPLALYSNNIFQFFLIFYDRICQISLIRP